MDYAKMYPGSQVPSTWFVDDVVRRNHLQTHEPKKRTKGQNIVSRLLFPIQSIIKLGRIQQASDFIGKKFIAGRTEPISVFSTSYYQWFERYYIRRVEAEKAEHAIASLVTFWQTHPIADVMRVDNGMTFRGTGAAVGLVGRFVIFLLNRNVIPLFSSPYQSYTNPHIEGHNRTFTEKLWTKHHFTSLDEIDRECDRFNAESREFFEYKFKERLLSSHLRYLTDSSVPEHETLRSVAGKKIHFIRFVERWKETDARSGVIVLNRFISVPETYLNQYVFVVLNLETAMLHLYSEHHGISTEIFRQSFPYTT